MSVTADQFAELLHDALLTRFPAGPGTPAAAAPGSAGSTALLFATVGRPVDATRLRPPEGTPPASAQRWVEQAVSELVDPLPTPGWSYLQGTRHLSREYDALVRAASAGRDGPADAVAVVEARIAHARRLLDDTAAVPISGPPVPYLPSSASPVGWYDPAGAHWQRLELSEQDPPPQPADGPRPRLNWLIAAEATSTWLDLRPVTVDSPDQTIDLGPTLATEPVVQPEQLSPFGRLLAERLADTSDLAPAPAVEPPAGVQGFAGMQTRFPIDPAKLSPPNSSIEVVQQNPLASTKLVPPISTTPSVAVMAPPVRLRRRIAEVLAEQPTVLLPALVDEARPEPATGDGFRLSFDFCWVGLDRVWLDSTLLATAGWHVPGSSPGSYSSGDLDEPGQAVPAVPIGFVAVKDVTITANWSTQDADLRPTAAGLGPFLLAGSEYATGSGTLRIPGIQIIAWMCEVPPVLPPS